VIDIVIVSYNRPDLLDALIDSIRLNTHLPYQIFIVDNASTDITVYPTLAYHACNPDITVVRNAMNIGYSAAVHEGVGRGCRPYLMILNNDTQVTAHWDVTTMNHMANNEDCGALGYMLMDDKGISKGCGVGFNNRLHGWNKPASYVENRYNKPRIVKYVGGSALFTTRETWNTVGGFNREYFFYCEDLQYCLDVYSKAGKNVYYIPHKIIHHHEGSLDTSPDAKRANRNTQCTKSLAILKKYYPDEPGLAEIL